MPSYMNVCFFLNVPKSRINQVLRPNLQFLWFIWFLYTFLLWFMTIMIMLMMTRSTKQSGLIPNSTLLLIKINLGQDITRMVPIASSAAHFHTCFGTCHSQTLVNMATTRLNPSKVEWEGADRFSLMYE